MKTIHEHADEISQTLGSRLKALRESRQWTLDALSQRANLSKPYLSRLEAGDRQPSIAALVAIARALAVPVASLFEQPDQSSDCVIMRGAEAAVQQTNGLSYTTLSGSTKPFNVHPLSVTVPPDRAGSESYQHDGEEWLHVVAGRLRLTVSGNTYELETGDSAHFDSRLPHRLDALDGREARIILVACPIPMTLHDRRLMAASVGGQFIG